MLPRLTVPGQASPLTTQKQPRLQQKEWLKGVHMLFFSSKEVLSCVSLSYPFHQGQQMMAKMQD